VPRPLILCRRARKSRTRSWGRLRSIHERSSFCNSLPLSLDDWPGRPTSSQCLLLCPWLGSTGEARTVGRARSASGFTVATLNFRTEHHLNAWCRITIMVANPAPLITSAKTYCSSLIEAFIPVSLPLIVARDRRQPSPALPDRK
jgi:hypothetical protein